LISFPAALRATPVAALAALAACSGSAQSASPGSGSGSGTPPPVTPSCTAVAAPSADALAAPSIVVPSPCGLEAHVTWDPLKIVLQQPHGGARIGQLGTGNIGALFVETATTPIHVHGTAGVAYLGSGTYQATYTLDAGGLAVVTLQWQSVLPSGRSSDSPHSEDLLVTLQMDRVNDVRRYGAELPIQAGEHFVGLMERVVDAGTTPGLDGPIETALDLRGQEATMFVTAPVALYSPFYLASTGYGLFVEGTWPGQFDLGQASDDLVSLAFEGPALRLHLIPGPDPRTILDRYTQLAGRPIVPPSWVFLPWRWRDENRNLGTFYDGTPAMVPYNSQLVEDVLMYQALDIPLGTMWIDRPWAIGPRGYDDFTWDTSRLPNPPGMIQWLRSRNIKLLLWIAPWVQGRMAEDAERLNYLMPDLAYQGDLPHVDFTNPAATAWWQGYLTRLVDQGIAGFKMDRADERVPYDSAHQTFDGRSTREVRNDYPRLYAGAASQALASRRGTDFILLPRAAYTGSQALAAFWSGDLPTSMWGLRDAIVAAQRAAIMGFSSWGSDIGGYSGPPDREVMARWIEFGCFTPIMEVGPTANRAPWDMPTDPAYDTQLIAILRTFSVLHQRLQDYTAQYAQIAHDTGVSIVRPLFVEFPDDGQAWDRWDEFFYGDDVLVGAVWQKGEIQMPMYLPAGEWRNAWNPSDVVRGPQTVTVDTPLERIPIYVRATSTIDLGDLPALWSDSMSRASRKPDLAALAATVH